MLVNSEENRTPVNAAVVQCSGNPGDLVVLSWSMSVVQARQPEAAGMGKSLQPIAGTFPAALPGELPAPTPRLKALCFE